MKSRSQIARPQARCPLVRSPKARTAAQRVTDEIKGVFPAGLAKPALRALAAYGAKRLEDMEAAKLDEITALHGIGPRAVDLLQSALKQRGLRPMK